jgi:signal transduction histidine kinase/ActR/RegA family two-component response regulator
LAGIAIGAMLVFILSLVIWAREVDVTARMREEALLRDGVIARMAEIEAITFPETNWDEAVQNLDNRFDAEWARTNLTEYLQISAPFEDLFVLDADDRPIYASRGPAEAPVSDFARFHGIRGLVADVREAESRRGRLAPPPAKARPHMLTRPIQASGFLVDGPGISLVTVSLVQPDFGASLPKGPRAPLVVTVLPVQGRFLTLLRERFQLSALATTLTPGDPPRGQAQVALETLQGGPMLRLVWTPHKPGTDLLQAAISPVLLVIFAFGAVGVVMVGRARRAAAALVASHRAQSEFLANMSHEIRTPLNGVVAIADVLSKTRLDAQQGELVRIIRSSGETLERLLSDVLDLSKIETGAVDIERAPFHLGEAVRAVAALSRPRGEEKGVTLTLEIAAEADAWVMGDVVRVKQVATNLISNAIKFTDAGGVVVRLIAREDGATWRLEVEDTGVGFDPADKARIFTRFQQADGSVTRRYGGTGLGLSISRQLVELMGGTLDCDSSPGQGSIFITELKLPPAPADAAHAVEPAATLVEAACEGRRLRILLADDHPTNRTVVQILLDQLAVDLTVTENGLEACEAFEAGGFDVVLMDMQMPVMDGLSATRRIRAHERRSRIEPAFMVMLTANAMRDHQEASLEAGADLHLAKPIQAEKLYAALSTAAARIESAEAAAA